MAVANIRGSAPMERPAPQRVDHARAQEAPRQAPRERVQTTAQARPVAPMSRDKGSHVDVRA
ncbi:MAG: hypothetical protein WCO17_07415 [Betaproteobacteria bacterium]